MSILKKQLSLKKDAKEIFRKMNKLGLSHFLDHMLMQNMCNIIDMAFIKKKNVFANYKYFYVKNVTESVRRLLP